MSSEQVNARLHAQVTLVAKKERKATLGWGDD